VPDEFDEFLRKVGPLRPQEGSSLRRLMDGERLVQVQDLSADTEPSSLGMRATLRKAGARTNLWIALRKDTALRGAINMYRKEVRPFTDKQIALLQNFAAQAVIAMENARLLTETREALEQQTATAEVLQVINASPGNLAPVFEAILDKAHTLCGATLGSLFLFDGKLFRASATHGYPEDLAQWLRQGVTPAATTQLLDDSVPWVHNPDLTLLDGPTARAVSGRGGVRTNLMLPLRKEGKLLGYITANRREVRPFTDKQIALLQNFAAQAVIAMENARLIEEQREALEQQTAMAEVLQVINASPGNLGPVFKVILEKAVSLCEASLGVLHEYDGVAMLPLAACGSSEMTEAVLRTPLNVDRGTAVERLVQGEGVVHIADVTDTEAYRAGVPSRLKLVEMTGARTALWVALRKDASFIGTLVIYRTQVRPFSDKEIALVENFAAQAVIAMENARLITETREALERQTATAEVLQVINTSPGNLVSVFDTILAKAHSLCGASGGSLMSFDGKNFHAIATFGYTKSFDTDLRRGIPPSSRLQTLIDGGRMVHIADLREIEIKAGEMLPSSAKEPEVRTLLVLPLRKDDTFLGYISAYRSEVRPFSNRDIALLENFATQAVIAMENARLLDEIRQRQAELRVTFDNMGDGVVMFDAEHRLAASNRNFQELLDIPDAILAGRLGYADYLHILAERGEFGADDVEAELARRLEDTDRELRLERTRPDGRVIEVRRNAVPDGGFVLIYSDITERKRSEAEIRAARDAAEAAYRDLKAAQASLIQAEKMASLGQLTAGIAHEIKNPLNFVNNFASLSVDLLDELKETAAPGFAMLDETRRTEIDDLTRTLSGNLEKINEHGNRADAIVRSMLEHSRGSSGERRSVDLNALVDEALNLAYHGARARDQSFNITLQRDFDEGITPITLVPQDVTRVLLNLFSNGFYAARRRQSMEATAGFEPTLKVVTRELGDTVETRVRDNGIGIPEEVKDKLFQPFFTTKPTGEGTGLGLSISYDIVTQQHGGSITVDSKVGEYSEFTIRLPRN
jgi:signal transduction histidine kinase